MSISQRSVVIEWYNVANRENSRRRRVRPSKVIKGLPFREWDKEETMPKPSFVHARQRRREIQAYDKEAIRDGEQAVMLATSQAKPISGHPIRFLYCFTMSRGLRRRTTRRGILIG